MTENTARTGTTSRPSTTTGTTSKGTSGGSLGSVSLPPVPDAGSDVDEQTHRRVPEAKATTAVPPAPPTGAGTANDGGTQESRTGASPVKDGAVKAAAAALAAARSAAKKVQSAIPEQGPKAPEGGETAKAGTASQKSAQARPEMHYASGAAPGAPAPGPAPAAPSGIAAAGIAGAAASREAGPRRVRLSVSRVDPWSVMKLAFLLSVALGFITVVATMVVWYVFNDMGTFATIQDFLQQTVGSQTVNIVQFIEFDRVVSLAVLMAIVDVVLLTAVATIMAILYNITAALVGGVHLTLTDE